MNRRELLALGSASLAGFAGCVGGLDGLGGDGPRGDDDGTSSEEATIEETGGKTDGTETTETKTSAETTGKTADDTFEDVEFAIVAGYPAETTNGTEYERRTVFTREDFVEVREVREGRGTQQVSIPVTPSDEAAERFVDVMNENGFTDEGVASCRWRETPDDPGWCLYTVVDGQITYAATMGNGLAATVESGDYLEDPLFVLQASSRSEAEELRERLKNDAE